MHLALLRRVVIGLKVIFLTGAAIASEMRPGIVKLARVEGAVEKIDAAGQRTRLSNMDQVSEADSIETGPDASLVAVFENGCAFKLGPGTLLQIEDFKLVPIKEITLPFHKPIHESSLRLKLKSGVVVSDARSVVRTARYEFLTAHGTIRFLDESVFRIAVRDSPVKGAAHPALRVDVIQGSVHFTSMGHEQDIQAGYALVLTEDSGSPASGAPALTPKVVALDKATVESLRQAVGIPP